MSIIIVATIATTEITSAPVKIKPLSSDAGAEFVLMDRSLSSIERSRNAVASQPNFSVGSQVVLILPEGKLPRWTPSFAHPYFPAVANSNGDPIIGLVVAFEPYRNKIQVSWGSGSLSDHSLEDINDRTLRLYSEWEKENMNMKKKEPVFNFDIKVFNRLILPDEKKQSIINVLKQHETSKTIFEDWGLGKTIEYGRGMNILMWGPAATIPLEGEMRRLFRMMR